MMKISLSSISTRVPHLSAWAYAVACLCLCSISLLAAWDVQSYLQWALVGPPTQSSQGQAVSGVSSIQTTGLIGAASGSIARAELLKLVSVQISGMGGEINSSSVDQPNAANDKTIKIKMEFAASNDDVQRILYSLETGSPWIYVERLAIRADNRAGTQDHLKVEIALIAGWRGAS